VEPFGTRLFNQIDDERQLVDPYLGAEKEPYDHHLYSSRANLGDGNPECCFAGVDKPSPEPTAPWMDHSDPDLGPKIPPRRPTTQILADQNELKHQFTVASSIRYSRERRTLLAHPRLQCQWI
jgi:hypothetical protein